ncbi:MAG TPA: penicillin-binding protein [Terriglobales bacterium]|nr:penicillin-binding protein [Terriglobales bacterium]
MAANTGKDAQKRIYILAAFFLFWAVVICARLVQLQVFDYGELEQHALRQQQRTIEVAPRRGIIFDRSGHDLAMSIAVDSIFAVPSEIPDPATAATLLAHVLKLDAAELRARFHASRTFCWVARKVDADASDRVRALNLRGIYFQKESKRFYPKRELAAQVLGYVGMDDEGLSGIEREFDDQLRGQPGRMLISVDARKRWFGRVERQPEPGENVVLTIDQAIQYIAERELDKAVRENAAAAGTVIVENPHTGEILALANRPTFNPNQSKKIRPQELNNRAISDIYEPGSTFKLVTLSAALDQRLTHPNELVDCQMGSIVVGGRRIHDWHPYGVMSVANILAHSSDVGTIKIGLRLGDDRLYHYIRSYGFGSQTGIDLPGETRGLTKPVSRWSKVSIGAISMGQEIGVSPIQLAAMVSSIANDGVWIAPRIVAGTIEPRSTPQTVVFHSGAEHRVISRLTAAEMKQMMEGVVLRGTGRKALLEGYTTAGKTGTAQKVDPITHAYSHSKYVTSFAGFAPVNNPAVVVVVILDSPITHGHEGGMVGAPLFQRIAQQVLEYLHVPHDVDIPSERQLLLASKSVSVNDLEEGSPDRLGAPLDIPSEDAAPVPPSATATAASGEGRQSDFAVHPAAAVTAEAVAAPPGKSESKPPEEPAPLPSSGTVVLDVEQGGIVVPSFLGKPLRAAIETAQNSGVEIDAIGDGVARDQSPPAGSRVPAGARVEVRFEQ